MARKISTVGGQLVDIGDEALQPRKLSFPKRKFGVKNPVERCFQPTWFDKWSWLHYREETDSAFCFVCTKAMVENKVRIRNMDITFISAGFTNWKDATSIFRKHEGSECHRAAVEAIVVLPRTTRDVGELLCVWEHVQNAQRCYESAS